MKVGVRSILVGMLLLIAAPAFAQVPASTDFLTVNVDPVYPRPYDTVTVTPDSTLIDLSSSQVSVSVNGKVVQKGSGATPVQVPVGAAGSKTTITVTAVTNDGKTYTQSLVLRPSDVSLLLEPQSTTHPFYRGGALVASQGTVRLIALPDFRTAGGASIPASSLVYNWKNGDQQLKSDSGIGKSVLVASAPVQFRDAQITVTVSTQDQSMVGQAQIDVSAVDPVARIYQNDPLLGPLFNYALPSSISMSDPENTFRGVAYYFAGTPTLTWSVNNTQSQTGPDITVRSNGSGSGTAVIGFEAKQPATSQLANTSMNVTFGAKKSLGIFGL